MSDLSIFILMCFVLGGMLSALVAWHHFLAWLEQRKTGHRHLSATPALSVASASATLPAPIQNTPAATQTPVPHAQWWPQVVQQVVHLLIVGESQEGKSTTARALLHARARSDDILVLDPHGKFNQWDVPVVGIGRDWIAIDTAFTALNIELSRRCDPAEPVGRPLTIFIDEYPAIAANCPGVKETFLALAREGAKPRMRLVVLTQDANVETLGISGQGAVRKNFTHLLLGTFAIQALPASRTQPWPAVLDHRGAQAIVDRSALPKLADQPGAHPRVWPVPVPVSELPGVPLTGDIGDTDIDDTADIPHPDAERDILRGIPQGRIDTIRKASEKGLTRSDIATLMGGNRNRMMAVIKQALEQVEDTRT